VIAPGVGGGAVVTGDADTPVVADDVGVGEVEAVDVGGATTLLPLRRLSPATSARTTTAATTPA